ncbi:MAG TPA: glycosyltransferase [Gammaproteobacteria bacterium]|nr:glycosyltransferase [Gammaproteobacteria bacterium]
MQKKLLIITDEMEVGGTQRQIVELARHLDRSNFALSLLYFRKHSHYVDELRALGVEVFHLPKRGRLDFGFFLRLCRHLREQEVDLIHAFSFSGELWAWLAHLFTGQGRLVTSVRSTYEWYTPLQWRFKRWITLDSAAVIANSSAGAENVALRMGVRRSLIDVVHNSVNPVNVQDEAVERSNDRIVFVGRLVDHKNLHCLLRGFAEVARNHPTAALDIVGDGPLREELEALALRLRIAERVHFHGERRDVPRFLLQAAIAVSTSYREGLCNAIMEAMSAGAPVIASNVGGNSELVTHGHNGMLFPSDDDETLAAMLLELLEDHERRRQMGENARSDMTRFHDPRRMAAEIERIYERCLLDERAVVLGR